MEKLPCKNCGSLILSTTYQKNDGICLLCTRGITKESCEICYKEATVLTNIDGKKVCLKCNIKLSIPLVELWKNSCNPKNNIFDIESLEIKPYPEFEEIFLDNSLKGFYYPLCSVKFKHKNQNQIFHILSHNGLWIDETKNSHELNAQYSLFKKINNKYTFQGNLKTFKGHNYIEKLYKFLEINFDLTINFTYKKFLNFVVENYPISFKNFDYEHYIESFFYYKTNKIKFKNEIKIDDFIPYEKIKNQNLFKNYSDNDFINIGEEIILNEKHFENQAELLNKTPLGCCWVEKYFQDGNSIFCFFDEEKQMVYCVNHYS